MADNPTLTTSSGNAVADGQNSLSAGPHARGRGVDGELVITAATSMNTDARRCSMAPRRR